MPVGAFLAWQVGKAGAAQAWGGRNPPAAAQIAPTHPSTRIGMAMLEFRLRNGHVTPQARAEALAALGDHPIAEEPFLLEGVMALAKGETARGEALLEEAKRRNPRNRMARLLLLDRYLRTERPREAAAELGILTVLVPRTSEVLIPQLAKMVTQPSTAGTLKGALSNNPGLLNAVLSRLAADGASADTILALASSGGPTPPGVDTQWQAMLVNKLAREGEVDRAYRLWREFGKLPASDGAMGLYDPGFRGLPGSTPFNWALTSGAEGVAERASGGALQASFYGRTDAVLAEQLLMLRPGRYRLQFDAEGDAKGEDGRLGWTLSCQGSNASLVQLPLSGITYAPRRVGANFTVPAGCRAQWLRLAGGAAEFPNEQSVTIRNLKLAREGS
ncbi:MAG TPA: hypothetical protein VEZ70_10225 [Allosphingosinicella sp.]|nr:hypothetical protein [Allosphingosinicella sp.]